MKIVYAGSPLASALVLSKIIEFSKNFNSQNNGNKIEIVGVLTNPPSAKGRSKELIPTEVSTLAKQNNIPVFEFEHLKAEERNAIEPLKADLLVTFDYGRIFGPKFLNLFRLGGINLHPSALPKYRGCTPVPSAILNGEKELGITVQKIALEVDSGDILCQEFVPLEKNDTTLFLMDGDGKSSKVTECGSRLIIEVLEKCAELKENETLQGKKQAESSTYTNFLKKEDGIIDWKNDASFIERQIRAYTPWPLCSTIFNGQKLTVLKAEQLKTEEENSSQNETFVPGQILPFRKNIGIEIACGKNTILVVKELQLQGKKAMDYKSFVNGAKNFFGSILG